MGQTYSGGIGIPTGFKLLDPQPIDDRTVVDVVVDLDMLPQVYEGLLTYSKAGRNFYKYTDIGWLPFGGGSYDTSSLQELIDATDTEGKLQTSEILNQWLNSKNYISTELDPTVPAWVKAITQTEVNNWNNAFTWGDHDIVGYELLINKGAANGYTPLDSNSKVPIQYLPPATLATTFVVNSQSEMLALSTAITGDIAVRTDLSKSFILRGTDPSVLADWQELLAPLGTVTSVNTLTADVTLNLSLTGGLLGITNGNTVNLDTRYSQQTLTAGANIDITGSEISATDTTYGIFNSSNDGLVPKRIGASETRFLREDGTWQIVTSGTTYSTNSLAELNAGADTVGKLQTSKNLNDWLNDKGYSTQTLLAGDNINIVGNVINAVDTIYTSSTLPQINSNDAITPRVYTSKILNDWLTAKGYITNYTVTESDVTNHEAAIRITESQITDLSHFSGAYTDLSGSPTNVSHFTNDAGYLTSVSQNDVTQHESAIRITESQITDLNHFSGSYDDLTDKPIIPNSYISNIGITNRILNFTGIGSAFNSNVDLSPMFANLVTSVNTKTGDVILQEKDIVGNNQDEDSATGSLTVDYNSHSHFNLDQTGTVMLTIIPPTLDIGESTSRIMYLTPNGFDTYFPADFETRVSGMEYLDSNKENWIVTRYFRTSTGLKQFSNLTVFPFNENMFVLGDVDGGASDTDYTLFKISDGGESNTIYTINMSGGNATNN